MEILGHNCTRRHNKSINTLFVCYKSKLTQLNCGDDSKIMSKITIAEQMF